MQHDYANDACNEDRAKTTTTKNDGNNSNNQIIITNEDK